VWIGGGSSAVQQPPPQLASRHGSGREGGSVRSQCPRRKRGGRVVRQCRLCSDGVRGRAGAHGRREEDEAGAGGVGQGCGVHGRQGIDALLRRRRAPGLW
jgi:hypothetical protein